MPAIALISSIPSFDSKSAIPALLIIAAILVAGAIATYVRNPFLFRAYVPLSGVAGALLNPVLAVFDFIVILLDGKLVRYITTKTVLVGTSIGSVLSNILIMGTLLFLGLLHRNTPFGIVFVALALASALVFILYWAIAVDRAERDIAQGMQHTFATVELRGSFVQLLILLALLIPVFIAAAITLDTRFHLFAIGGKLAYSRATILQYTQFIGSEFLKALPGLDFSEIYGWRSFGPIKAASIWGKHFVMLVRGSYDLLIFGFVHRFFSFLSLNKVVGGLVNTLS